MRNIRLAVFDLDGTLATIGAPIEPRTIDLLRGLSDRGIQLAVCSGKPCAHLTGLMRQAGLAEVILMGENGAVTQFGTALPPTKHYRLPYSDAAASHLSRIRKTIEVQIHPGPWFQPNEVVVTPFFKDQAEHAVLSRLIKEQVKADMALDVFEHVDSFDICPAEINKGNALKRLIAELGLQKSQVAAVGDGLNDIPLWKEAGLSIQVGSKVLADVDIKVQHIAEAIMAI